MISSPRFHSLSSSSQMKNMKPPLLLFIFISVSLQALTVSVAGNNVRAYVPTDDIAVDCGSPSPTAVNNQTWIGDANDGSNYSPIDKTRSSVIASANSSSPDVPGSVPYYTARLSRSEFAYSFHVTEGPKFVRLHFFPSDYLNFRRAESFFSVKAASYTLLHNFSASLFSDHTRSASFYREFCLTVGSDQILNVTFAPTPGSSEAYAFVNGIEVVSMPERLYYNTVVDSDGITLAGQKAPYNFRTTDALEAVKRLNVGGQFIGSAEDTGMYRSWDADDDYVTSSSIGVLPVNTTIQLNYGDQAPNYTAPDSVYTTARTMGTDKRINLSYNLTWSIEVDTNFYYLVRLHFCEFQTEINNPSDRLFEIFIDSLLVENRADIILWSGKKGVPIYRDYAVSMYDSQKKTTNLSIALGAYPDGYTVYSDAILNGLEIFKISNIDGNLAGLNPDPVPNNHPALPPASKASLNHSKTTKIAIIAGVASGFIVLSLLAFFLYRRRNRAKDSTSSDGASWWGPVSYTTTKSTKTQESSLPSDLCRHFSLAEIRGATNNFDEVFIIGVGGFGNVYKGYVDGGATQVAIKRLNPGSKQGLHEFMTEIEMLSQLRHLHLVSLIGFCNDAGEMILVYDYMARGTVRDHLYNTDNPPLPWKQRLEICTGAARGLHYLHTGAKHTIIHRDMKTTNILLDEKWVAKVSDFGLSKVGPTSVSKPHVSTVVKGTFGYLDPEYYMRQQLTDKSDVYSFGVVLFEVLCGRPAVNRTAQKKQISLAAWAQSCCKSGTVDKIVDPHLKGAIAPECLNKFCEIAMSCLQGEGAKRPSMNDVVWGLEFALQLQLNAEQEVIDHVGTSVHNGDESDDDAAPIRGNTTNGSHEVFSSSNSRAAAITTSSDDVYDESTTSYDSEKLLSGAVFSEIKNPQAR